MDSSPLGEKDLRTEKANAMLSGGTVSKFLVATAPKYSAEGG